MTAREQTLDQIQRWMQAVITHPAGIEAGVAAAHEQSAPFNVDGDPQSIILPSRALDSAARLAIYCNAYYTRLLHVLRELFPAVRYAVDEDAFDDFALGYLQEHPSRSYTLGRLAEHFVEFLEQSRSDLPDEPDAATSAEFDDSTARAFAEWASFVVELARLEYLIDEVFDGPGTERRDLLIRKQLTELQPHQWQRVVLIPSPGLRLLACEFPVNAYYTAFRQQEEPEIPSRQTTFVALSRRDYIVRRFSLSAVQYDLLLRLCQGESIATAVQSIEAADADELAQSLAQWFTQWAAEEFFERIEFRN